MSIKQPIYHEFDLNTTSGNSRVISLTHTDDAHVDTIELCVKQQGAPVDITGATVIARMVLHSTTDVLLNDSVTCTVNDAGNILIPFDNAAVQTRKGIVKIEVNITRTPDIITLQLPLWVKINGSILDDATVDPHSEGTIPELLKDAADALEEATQALEQAGDYDSLEHKPQINGNTLSGNKTSDELGLQNKLTAGENVNIDANGNITITGVTKYRNVPTEQVDDCIENGVLYLLYISGLQSNAQIIAHNNYTTITQHALLDDGRLMYRMRQGETPWQPAGEWSAWESIGGSQIASGVVNANGTITFTNSDGTTFTTTGSSVIGADGIGIADVHIDGGGDLIIEYTTGHMENVGHVVGADGQDYVLTNQDKTDIANIVLQLLPTTQGVLYGNTSN